MTRRVALAVVVTCVLVTGCSSQDDSAMSAGVAALGPRAAPSTSSSEPPGSRRCNDDTVTQSLRPAPTPPRPGDFKQGSTMWKIVHRGNLIVGVDQNTAGLSYVNRKGHFEGLEVDLAKRIAASLGVPARFVALVTDQRIPALQTKPPQGVPRVDLVVDAMTITCPRREQVGFSTVYLDAAQRLLVRSDSTARGLADLAGKRICVTRGGTAYDTITQPKYKHYHLIPYQVDARTDCLVALETGAADAILADDTFLEGFRREDPATKIVGNRITDEPYGLAINRSDTDFIAFVNGVLARITPARWRSLLRRNGLPDEPPYSTVPSTNAQYLPPGTTTWLP